MVLKKIAVVTGGSRGLGAALVRALQKKGFQVIAPQREDLDLSNPSQVDERGAALFKHLSASAPEEIILINNAASADPYGCFGALDLGLAQSVMNVNVVSSGILMNSFIQVFQNHRARKTIINVSSVSAEKAAPGGSIYCASKAALEVLTKTIALEQRGKPFPVRVCAFRPGLMDTELQARARNLDVTLFPSVTRFQENFNQGRLVDPMWVANQWVDHLILGNVKEGAIYDVSDLPHLAHGIKVPFCM